MPEIIDYTKVGGTFIDNGDGDMDFYSYWYSICYFVGMINVYRKIFRDMSDYDEMIRRFLLSREISFSNDSDSYLLDYLFKNWRENIEGRGTLLINDYIGKSEEVGLNFFDITDDIESDIEENIGLGVIGNVGNLGTNIYLGFYHSIEFDILLKNGDTLYGVDGELFYRSGSTCFIHIEKVSDAGVDNIGIYTISYNCYTNVLSYNASLDVTVVHHVKFIRIGAKIYLYIDDELKDSITVVTINAYTFLYLFNGVQAAVANLVATKFDNDYMKEEVYSWLCNEGSGFVLDSNKAPLYSAVLDVEMNDVWGDIWVRNSGFDNTNYKRIDGEVRRLINHTDGEYLLELIKTSELGLSIDISSPISEEASCVNLNKSYEKGVVKRLSRYPLIWSSDTKPIIENGYIRYFLNSEIVGIFGLNSIGDIDMTFYKPNTLVPFMPIPIATDSDNITGYEISFVIKTDASINLQFGIRTFGSEFDEVNYTKGYDDDSLSNFFLDDTEVSLCNGSDLWVRGVYSLIKLSGVSENLNINIGRNLYNDSESIVKYIMPIINFYGTGVYTNVWLKDIVVRPLSLNTSKGVVSNKNKMIGFIKNNSGKSDDVIEEFIDSKLIPYNCSTNIQFL